MSSESDVDELIRRISINTLSEEEMLDNLKDSSYNVVTRQLYDELAPSFIRSIDQEFVAVQDKAIIFVLDDEPETLNYIAKEKEKFPTARFLRVIDKSNEHILSLLVISLFLAKSIVRAYVRVDFPKTAETMALMVAGNCIYIQRGVTSQSTVASYASKEHEKKAKDVAALIKAADGSDEHPIDNFSDKAVTENVQNEAGLAEWRAKQEKKLRTQKENPKYRDSSDKIENRDAARNPIQYDATQDIPEDDIDQD